MKKLSLALVLALCVTMLSSCGAPKRYSITYMDVFDTVSEFTAYCDSAATFDAISDAVHGELLRLHRLFDIYETYEGIVNAKTLNDAAGGDAVEAEADLLALVALGTAFAETTDGKLNVALGSVLSLWHECREAGDRIPTEAALIEAAKHTEIGSVVAEGNKIRITDAETRLDFGAIAKGYAAEAAARVAESFGLSDFVLNLGGNLVVRGKKPDGAWKIGIQNPDGGILTTLSVCDVSVVTSGDYQRYFEVDGVRYAHIIDPDTGMPARRYRAVTVIASDSAVADALSTALFCMTREAGAALCETYGAEALWVLPDGTQERTEGFGAYET